MNIIGIDVSQGESHATLITKEAEEIAFKFKHNKSGFQILNSYIKPGTIIIFETTGVYSAQGYLYLLFCLFCIYKETFWEIIVPSKSYWELYWH